MGNTQAENIRHDNGSKLMRLMRRIIPVLCLQFWLQLCVGQNLRISYAAPYGISAMSYGNNILIDFSKQLGRPFSPEVFKLINKNKKVISEWSHIQAQSWDDAKKEYSVSFTWGTASVKYMQIGDTLHAKITLTNKTKDDTFCGMSFCPLTLNLGKRPSNFKEFFPYYTNNINSPGVVRADLSGYSILLENSEQGKKVYIGFLEENNTKGSLFRIWNGNIPYNGMNEFNSDVELRLKPGQSFSYTMAIKFVKPGITTAAASTKAYTNFRNSQPFKIKWSDRRPIGALFLSSFTGQKFPANPRNWSMLPATEVNTKSAEGISKLKASTLEYANRSIQNMRDMDAQGMITWDIEGQEFPHPLSYIGSPELLAKLAPEMNEIADEYFGIFKKAGFKTGICIRPDSVVFQNGGTWIEHVVVRDPLATMIRKINYARQRWGCTIYYIDSNIGADGQTMDHEIFRKLNEQFPDLLLIPEHERVLYYSYTAPFSDLKFENILLDADVKATYPEAFMVINVPEGLKDSPAKNVDRLYQSLQQGNIFLFRAWYTDEPTNSWIKQAWKRYRQNVKK
jgi:hypothetical protein